MPSLYYFNIISIIIIIPQVLEEEKNESIFELRNKFLQINNTYNNNNNN